MYHKPQAMAMVQLSYNAIAQGLIWAGIVHTAIRSPRGATPNPKNLHMRTSLKGLVNTGPGHVDPDCACTCGRGSRQGNRWESIADTGSVYF